MDNQDPTNNNPQPVHPPQPELQPTVQSNQSTGVPQPAQAPQPSMPAPYQPVAHSQQVEQAQPQAQAQSQPYAFGAANLPAEPVQHTDMSVLVLAWLTYAFWGWTVLALSILTTTIVATMVNDAETGGFTPYGIAALLVLLPIAFVCDRFYIKKEVENKKGADLAVAAIHAVVFALFGVSALIAAVISVVTMFTSSSDATGSTVALISALIVAVFYAMTFLRTLYPKALAWFPKKYPYIMLALAGIVVILGFIGPVAKERATRDDRLIVAEIGAVTDGIRDYAQEKNKLPDSLNEIKVRDSAKVLIDRNLVDYKKETQSSSEDPYSSASDSRDRYDFNNNSYGRNGLKYQLCVDYKAKSGDTSGYNSGSSRKDEYLSSVYAYSHPAGEVCYKLITY